MDKETLIRTEERIRELFKEKRIRFMFHLSGGNEEELIRIFENVRDSDWVFSTHRSHYHALLKGMSPDELIDEVVRGKSMHLYSKKLKFLTSSIVGGVLPIAVGVAMALKRKGSQELVWVFVGDMCAEMGIFHECSKYAQRHDLPIRFVIEDNSFCINTVTQEAWGTESDEGCESKIIKYVYERIYPHAGSGDWVDFSNV